MAKSTRLGRTLVAGMTQILAHVRGETQLESYCLPGSVDVNAIRRKAGIVVPVRIRVRSQ